VDSKVLTERRIADLAEQLIGVPLRQADCEATAAMVNNLTRDMQAMNELPLAGAVVPAFTYDPSAR
jgi:hypothetical protein